jgi:hypothetical protein
MKKVLVIVGIVLLLGAAGYVAWTLGGDGRYPFVSYRSEVEDVITYAEGIVQKQEPPRTVAASLQSSSAELRKRLNALIDKASDMDKRRPSYRLTDDIVMQIEYAAQKPESADVVRSRFEKAKDGMVHVRAMLGTAQDNPR